MGEVITDFKPVELIADKITTDFKPVGLADGSTIEPEDKEPSCAGGSFEDYGSMPWSEVAERGLESFPESAKQVGKDIVTPIAHPIETAKSIGNLGVGLVQKLIPGKQDKEQYADALGEYLSRYTSIEGFKEAFATDPAGIAFDVASALIPAGTASKLGITKKAGKALGTVIGTPAKQILGVTTGVGSGPIRKAMQGGKAFRDTMTRKVLMEEVVANSNSGLRSIANDRRVGYRKQLAEIRKSDVDIDISPIRKKLNNLMSENEFNIRRIVDEDTGKTTLDFSRSTLNKKSQGAIKQVIEKVDDWGSQPKDLTAGGLDILKKNLEFSSE